MQTKAAREAIQGHKDECKVLVAEKRDLQERLDSQNHTIRHLKEEILPEKLKLIEQVTVCVWVWVWVGVGVSV